MGQGCLCEESCYGVCSLLLCYRLVCLSRPDNAGKQPRTWQNYFQVPNIVRPGKPMSDVLLGPLSHLGDLRRRGLLQRQGEKDVRRRQRRGSGSSGCLALRQHPALSGNGERRPSPEDPAQQPLARRVALGEPGTFVALYPSTSCASAHCLQPVGGDIPVFDSVGISRAIVAARQPCVFV